LCCWGLLVKPANYLLSQAKLKIRFGDETDFLLSKPISLIEPIWIDPFFNLLRQDYWKAGEVAYRPVATKVLCS
jgi:hypothetical protein